MMMIGSRRWFHACTYILGVHQDPGRVVPRSQSGSRKEERVWTDRRDVWGILLESKRGILEQLNPESLASLRSTIRSPSKSSHHHKYCYAVDHPPKKRTTWWPVNTSLSKKLSTLDTQSLGWIQGQHVGGRRIEDRAGFDHELVRCFLPRYSDHPPLQP